MPAGNPQPVSLAWQPVPDAPGALLYPLIRKIDTTSSNSYLLATADVLILIDPGGLPEQVESLVTLIRSCRSERERPVFVFLTHAHIDHFLGIQSVPAFAYQQAVVFAVQETGADALERGDGGITQADLLNQKISPMAIALPLITRNRAKMMGITGMLAFPGGAEITITRDRIGNGPASLERETIRFGPGPGLEVYHTAGHSPDSICIRMGSLLFCGDIVFAANPGIAGLVGWSQEDLIHSVTGIEDLLAGGGITAVCPGHGRIIAVADAVRMFASVRNDAVSLENIAELNNERAGRTAAFAEDSMEQVNELFTIMAGRLYYVSYVLDELGESELAEETMDLIRGKTVDELMEAFRDFATEHNKGDKVSMHLALKAGQVIAKLQRSFDCDILSRVIDPSFVTRAGRLLSDYITTLRGFRPPYEIRALDIGSLVEALITGLSIPSCSDEDLLSGSDDDAAFTQILLSRIGTRPLLEDIDVRVNAHGSPLIGLIDSDAFTDLMTYILEDLVGTMSSRIEIDLIQNDADILIALIGDVPEGSKHSERRTTRFLQGLAVRAGGSLMIHEEQGRHIFEIRVNAVL